jgi:small conductance mechanosensitive channel
LAWSPKIIGGVLVLLIGFWMVNIITNVIAKSMKKSKLDADLIPFLRSMVNVLLKVLVVLTAAGVVGIEITAYAALLAGAGLAIGAAMSGTLSHFASGVMILIFKPYKIGDLVNLQDNLGTVKEIQIFNTIIETLDNKMVIIPNGIATSGVMTNLSATGKLRVDLKIMMPYEKDFDKVKAIIRGALDKVTDRLPDEPTIEINHFGDNGAVLYARPYATDAK